MGSCKTWDYRLECVLGFYPSLMVTFTIALNPPHYATADYYNTITDIIFVVQEYYFTSKTLISQN